MNPAPGDVLDLAAASVRRQRRDHEIRCVGVEHPIEIDERLAAMLSREGGGGLEAAADTGDQFHPFAQRRNRVRVAFGDPAASQQRDAQSLHDSLPKSSIA